MYPALHITDTFVSGKATLNPREVEVVKSVLNRDQYTLITTGPGFTHIDFHMDCEEWDTLLDLCPSLSHKRTMTLPGFIMAENG